MISEVELLSKELPFEKVKDGQEFVYCGRPHTKKLTFEYRYLENPMGTKVNAIRLDTFVFVYIADDVHVHPTKFKLIEIQ